MALLGIAVLVLGFVLRANPLLIVVAAALVTGMAAAWAPGADVATVLQAGTHTLAAFGKADYKITDLMVAIASTSTFRTRKAPDLQ